MWASEKDKFCAKCGSPRDWRQEDVLTMIEVTEEAQTLARERARFAQSVQWMYCIRAILDGYPVRMVAERAGFNDEQPENVIFEDDDELEQVMGRMFGMRPPRHPTQKPAHHQFAAWLCNELYRHMVGKTR
jgi:hypothetical protein